MTGGTPLASKPVQLCERRRTGCRQKESWTDQPKTNSDKQWVGPGLEGITGDPTCFQMRS
eukprot:CAMPEP_0194762404 /NCGR_PEP_ID=MMETSP0323_2-20130528/15656_1 /TAXON_ID=2866 ORGANISM="Crypthecodinium cohnii, Strain Seligo" /NCGR_SAMPLE_ID=MMETSP0323_2 /ASSEMBLY_ACC=CAM_ASM_000346 /LENGTH=59 /DNA_ID=CAMNT_0039684787 /DNA_START=166 /DNA_END=342 /DNA_ORIENTATION=-